MQSKILRAVIGKNEFKCFNCRIIFLKKDGNWFDWDQMQVNLCRKCDKVTAKNVERSWSS